MISQKSYARITLALDIVRKLDTGYHEVDTVKQKIDLFDEISIEESDKTEVICNNPYVPTDNKNLVIKIVDKVKQNYGIDKNVSIKIKKQIPVQGGLAGASSNSATTLELLNNLWNLDLTTQDKTQLAHSIGMDIPGFFYGNTFFDKETTDNKYSIKPGLPETNVVLVLPDFGVSTSEAYSHVNYDMASNDKDKTEQLINSIKNQEINGVKNNMHNDFEGFMFNIKPKLKSVKEKIKETGCNSCLMSGSGSSFFAITEDKSEADEIKTSLKDNGIKAIVSKTLN